MRGGGNEGAAAGLKKGPWTAAEDGILVEHVRKHGEGNWNAVQKSSSLSRCGKSCRLRWANHLRPNLKKGAFSPDEEVLILRLHAQMGNKWARMAAHLPGRTDNEIKNYWNTRMKRRQRAGLPMYPPEIQRHATFHHQNHPPSATAPPPANPTTTHFSAPLIQLLGPIGFPTAGMWPSLQYQNLNDPSPELQRIKRLRDESLGFQLNFSSPLYQPPLPQQQRQTIQCDPGNFDLDPVAPLSSCSVKMELPSTQLFPEPTGSGCSGLMDTLLQEAESHGDLQRDGLLPDMKWIQLGGSNNGGEPHRCHNSDHSSANKQEAAAETNPMGEDTSALLNMIPTTVVATGMAVPEWCNNGDGGEMSSGPSSVITNDEIRLEMRHLASSLSMGLDSEEWSLGSCPWGNMPGIC